MKQDEKQAMDLQAQGMTRAQIADVMGKSVRQVKSLLERARAWQRASSGQRAAILSSGLDITSARHGWRKVKNADGSSDSVFWKAESAVDDAELIERVADAFRDIPAYKPRPVEMVASDLLTLYVLTDAHIGQYSWGDETGGQDYDLHHAERDICDAFTAVTSLVPDGGEALLILNGDTLHADSQDNMTPSSKNILDVDGRQFKVLDTAIRSIAWVIEHLLDKHQKVKVRVQRGNHDENAHHILTFALSERYRNAGRVIVVKDPNELFMVRHGSVLIAAEHGDRAKAENFVHKVADVCPYWSETHFRYGFTGHVHRHQVARIGGMLWHSLDAFCPSDSYGYRFSGRRNQTAMVFSKDRGLILTANDPIERGE